MSSDVVAFDAASFLDRLSFGSAELARARTALRTSKEPRGPIVEASQAVANDATTSLRKGTALYLLGRLREAAAALSSAGDSPQARLVRGKVSLEDADPIGATAAFSGLTGAGVDGPELALDLAEAYALSGDWEGAKAAAQRIGSDRKADALFAEGAALDAQGKHAEGRAKWEAALAADPAHARTLFHLAHAHDLAGDDDVAIDLYTRLAALEPTHVNGLLNLGLLLEDHDRFADAEALYRRVLAADPVHERARLYLKDVLAAQTMYFDEDSERKEDRRNQVLRTPISEFELSVRSRNCLAKMEIKTLGDLICKTEAELLAYKNFGETSLQEIKDILAQKGLRLGMGRDEAEMGVATREEAEAELAALFGGKDEAEDDDDLDDDDLGDEDEEETGEGSAPAAAPVAGEDPRAMPIEALDLSTRARRCVEALEIETVGDLADRTEAELMANKNFGQTSLAEVRKKLTGLGLSLKGGSSEEPPPAV